MIPIKLKQSYVDLLENGPKGLIQNFFYLGLQFLSVIYYAIISLRNLAYDLKILPSYRCSKKIICIGNLSWAGTGKTTLTLYLCRKLSLHKKIAILRRGWGQDEQKLLNEQTAQVYSQINRVKLAKKLYPDFDCFILDDGFQYRKLNSQINIVIFTGNQLNKQIRLLPAGIFRESFSSLKRADILLINYAAELAIPSKALDKIRKQFPQLPIFMANYKIIQFFDLQNKTIDINSCRQNSIAALTATGYPQGFFNQLKQAGIKLKTELIYPDHYEFSKKEFSALENSLLSQGIELLLITKKDCYHLPGNFAKIKIVVASIDICIDAEDKFLSILEKKLAN